MSGSISLDCERNLNPSDNIWDVLENTLSSGQNLPLSIQDVVENKCTSGQKCCHIAKGIPTDFYCVA